MPYQPKLCVLCGSMFQPRSSRSQACDSCKRRICEHCGQSFIETSVARITHGFSRFCSRKCYFAARWGTKHWETRTCPICGKQYQALRSDIHKTCSAECGNVLKGQSRSRQIRLGCDWCGKLFYRPPSDVHSIRVFCCQEHSTLWWAEYGLHGKEHPRWTGGHRNCYGPNWKEQSAKARQRDECTCQECGMTETQVGQALDVHHKIPFKDFGQARYKEANHLANLVTYCKSCHMKAEAEN